MTPASRRRVIVAAVLLLAAAGPLLVGAEPLRAQAGPPTERLGLPTWGRGEFDGRYPVRVLTLETARMLDRGDAIVGFGDARYPILPGRVEVLTNTISDAVGVANLGLKLGVREPSGRRPGVAVGVKYYRSYPGLINKGVRRIAESFSTVTDAEVDISGWVGYAAATWAAEDGATGLHLGLQAHVPTETRFEVADSVKGGGGVLTFEEGEDVSVMWGVDHRLLGTKLVTLAEAGWSFGLERARFGAGIDAGSQRWRIVVGVTYPGVETDIATEPRDFVVNPVFSVHHRF